MLEPDLSIVIPYAGNFKQFGNKHELRFDDGRTIIRRQLDIISQVYPEAEVVLVLGYEVESIEPFLPDSVRVVENENYMETGNSRSIAMGLRITRSKRVLVLYGDLFFGPVFLRETVGSGSTVYYTRKHQEGVGLTVEGDRLVRLDYGLTNQWTRTFALEGRELDAYRRLGNTKERRSHMAFEMINEITEAGGVFRAVPTSVAIDIDTREDYKRAKKCK